ncbi:MAG: POTRA domain-containing protein, partial [Cyanobacteria bacterium J06635_10]
MIIEIIFLIQKMAIAAKVTYTFAMSFLLIFFSSLKNKPTRAQTVDNVQQIENSPSLPELPQPQDVQPPSPPVPPAPAPQQRLPPPSELLKPAQPTLPSDEQFPAIEQIFVVKQFEFTGNTAFSDRKLTELLAEFTNKPINFDKLLEARSKIEQLYIDEGYITSGAYIPEQTLTDGVVKIEVIEGTLEDIRITGLTRLKPSYIRNRIANRSSSPLNQKDLLEALELLQINPLIQKLQAKLIRGSFPGSNLLTIEVTEADSFNTQIILDNSSSPSVGTMRRQVQVNEANLLGLGDGISLVYSNTDGSNTIDASYSLPLNSRNGTLTFSYNNRSSDIIEDIFNSLDIESASQNYELTFRQPLLQTTNQEFALGITASHRNSDISSS